MITLTPLNEQTSLKMSIISTIQMLQDSIKHPYVKFHFEELWNTDIENLESIRDTMVREYNKQF